MAKKEIGTKSNSQNQKPDLPSAVDDAANVMSKYSNSKKRSNTEEKKPSFPPIDYEKPPHY